MFYKIDSAKVTFHEYWWGSKKNLTRLLEIALIKVFRLQIASSVDDPNVETLQPFQVAGEAFPEFVRGELAPLMQEFAELGFHSPVFHAVSDGSTLTRIYEATFIHANGEAFGRIHLRLWDKPRPPRKSLFPVFVSLLTDRTFLVSTAGKPDMHSPPSCQVNRITGATATALWQSHQQKFTQLAKPFYSVTKPEGLLWAIETYHAEVRDFHLKRGVFKPMSAAEQQKEAASRRTFEASAASGLQHAEILVEVQEAQQKPTTSVRKVIAILAVSAIAFIGVGAKAWSWDYVLLLIPILLFHEGGHYIAMRIFHYRNLKMFFIPFFGAAVTGQNYNVPGWKKVIVSLMGPVPGIILGAILGTAGIILHQPLMTKAALLLLIINGFNLLPILPLDGGRVMHAIFFSRHHLLDTGFRLVTALLLLGLCALLKTRALMYVAIASLVALPTSYKLARIANNLGKQGISPASPDDQTIPTATAQAIITEVKKSFPNKLVNNKTIAQHTLATFETLNARPPSWAASIAFVAAHFLSFVGAIVFAVALFLAQNDTFKNIIANAAFLPRLSYTCGTAHTWSGGGSEPAKDCNTIVATFKHQPELEKAFQTTQSQLPANAKLETFGQTLLLALPAEDDAARKEWVAKLKIQSTNLFVDGTNFIASFSLMCVAKTAQDATNLQQQLQDYFSGTSMFLVPPWLPIDPRLPQERAQHDLARRTYARLSRLNLDAINDQTRRDLSRKISQARRQGDMDTVAKLQEDEKTVAAEAREKHLQALLSEGPARVDLELAGLFTNYNSLNYTNPARQDLLLKMGARMGQLPLENGKLTPDAQKYAARWGSASCNGLVLNVNFTTFYRVFDGAPALTDWLCGHGCIGFKYGFQGQVFTDSDDLDD